MPRSPTLLRLAIIGLGFAGTIAAAATPASDRRFAATENRDARQDTRITTGLANGSINAQEAARLDAQQARIDTSQARLASDGHFSRKDQARIHVRQDVASRSIARKRHNQR